MRRKNRKYLVVTHDSVNGVSMTPALAAKLREMSRVPLMTFSSREGLRR